MGKSAGNAKEEKERKIKAEVDGRREDEGTY